MTVDPDEKAIRERIATLEGELEKAHEYVRTGAGAHWHRFRPLFVDRVKGGEVAPPHKDWVRSTFIPRCEKALAVAERQLDRLCQKRSARARTNKR